MTHSDLAWRGVRQVHIGDFKPWELHGVSEARQLVVKAVKYK